MSCCSDARGRRGETAFVALVALTYLLAAPRAFGAEPITAADLLRLRSVSSVSVAWNGARAVYAVRSVGTVPTAAGGEEWVNQSHLFLIDLDDESPSPRQLTFGARYDRRPVISPDGRRVAFERGPVNGEADPGQVWVLPLEGGEARPVTKQPAGAGDPVWAPDSRRLLFASNVSFAQIDGTPPWPSNRPRRTGDDVDAGVRARPDGSIEEIRAWLSANVAEGDPRVITRLHFQEEKELRGPRQARHLFVVDVDGEGEPSAVPRAVRITDGFFDHRDAAFMPDGQRVVYAARKTVQRDPDDEIATDLWHVNADGTGDALLLSLEGWSLRRPRPSRDGSVIAFSGQQTDAPAHRPDCIGTVPWGASTGANVTWLTGAGLFDLSVIDFAWAPAQSAVYFTVARAGGFPLMTMAEGLLEPAVVVDALDGLDIGVNAFGAGGGRIVYAATSPTNPCVLRVRDARGRDRVVHDINEWVAERRPCLPEEGWIDRPDGVKVQYWLMRPEGASAEAPAPLVLEIHGGPSAMWGPGEHTMWLEFQLLCARGFGVVYANPRGSSGYGYDFVRANFQDWSTGPAGDVLAAVDRACLEEWVDGEKLLVTGGSYGGYLTAWIIGNDHRFAAAVAQRGVYDLATFYGEGNAFQLVEWAMGGFPWNPRVRTVLQRESPFTYVNRIRTPLLIMHASDDLRTGVSQSEMLYRALRQVGRPVEYVRYHGAGHDLSRTGAPRQRMDRLNRIIEFFERFREP